MKRIPLTDGSGSWFNRDSAIEFGGASDWNGNNNIHRATGSQWSGEDLYYTASGNWVRRCWSAYDGTLDTYEFMDVDDAIRWLSCNDHHMCSDLPEKIRSEVEKVLQSMEV